MRIGIVVKSLVVAALSLTSLVARATEPPAVYVISPPPPPDGERADAAPKPLERKLVDGSPEVALGTTVFSPNLSRMPFSGVGIPVGSADEVRFRQSGRQLGLRAPTLVGAEVAFNYTRRYVAVGLVGFMAGNPSGADITPVPPSSPGAKLVDPGGLLAYGGGIDLAGVLPVGPVDIQVGGVMGIRGFSVPITGFKLTSCQSKHGTYPCNELATTGAQMVLEPRVTLQYSPMRAGFFLGAYAGAQLANGFEPTVGFFIGIHASHEALAP